MGTSNLSSFRLWSFKYLFIHSVPATDTGAPKSSIMTCFLFPVKFSTLFSFNVIFWHQFIFNSLARLTSFPQDSHLQALQPDLLLSSESFLSFDLPLSLGYSPLSLDLLLCLEYDLISPEKSLRL